MQKLILMSESLPKESICRQLKALAWDLRGNKIHADLVDGLTELEKRSEDVAQNDPHQGSGKARWLSEVDRGGQVIQCAGAAEC